MSKKILLAFIAVFAVFGLASCETEPTLTEIVVSGIEDISVDNGATFNVLDGVTALGNDDVDYTDQITLVTTSSAVNTETGALDTLQAGVHFVRYEVRVGDIVAQYSRNITVKAPVAVEKVNSLLMVIWLQVLVDGMIQPLYTSLMVLQ